MLSAVIAGIRTGLGHWKSALVVYALQLLLAFAVGFQVYHVFEASIGRSLEIDKLLAGYDHTVVSDFLHVHGASLSPLVGQLRWLLILYALFSVFLQAGLLSNVAKSERGWQAFWQGGAAYFFPFLKIALVIAGVAAIWSGGLWMPFLAFFPKSLEQFSSEKVSVQLLLLVAVVWSVGLVFLFNWSVAARLVFIEKNGAVLRAVAGGWHLTVQRWLKTTGLSLLFTLMLCSLLCLYWWAEHHWGMVSSWLVLVFFFIQQVLIFVKIMIRIMLYAGMKELHGDLGQVRC